MKYLLVGLVVLLGCNEGDQERKATDNQYFPLQTGFFQIYTVDETVYTEFNPPEILAYELKVEVVDSFLNAEGGYTFVIHRSTRATENDPWQFQEVWSARTNAYQAVLTEGNISYVRIAFPVFKNKEWNGNALNTFELDSYLIENVGDSYELSTGMEFKDALVIKQEDELTPLKRDQREEVYARDAGLIYKSSAVLNYCDDGDPGGCFGRQIIKDGIELVQVLKEYGQN